MVQVNQTKQFLRFKFIKRGSLQYISHLDLVRTMHKVIVRAKLPLWYTEGFNPKPKMIFAAPLSIGTESECEFMDLRMNEYIDPAFYTTRGFGLDEVLPWDMIDCGVTKEFLLRERKKAYEEKTTPSCAEHCNGCGANKLGGKNRWCN